MDQKLLLISFTCDIVLMSLFIWHSLFRTTKLTREIHSINEKTDKCPYRIRRVK